MVVRIKYFICIFLALCTVSLRAQSSKLTQQISDLIEYMSVTDTYSISMDRLYQELNEIRKTADKDKKIETKDAAYMFEYMLCLTSDEQARADSILQVCITDMERHQRWWKCDYASYMLAYCNTLYYGLSANRVFYVEKEPTSVRNSKLAAIYRAKLLFDDYKQKEIVIKDENAKILYSIFSLPDLKAGRDTGIEDAAGMLLGIFDQENIICEPFIAYLSPESERSLWDPAEAVVSQYMKKLENRILMDLGQKGYASAFFHLGQKAEKAYGFDKPDPEVAFQAYQRCVEMGHEHGTMRYATCLALGKGCEPDPEKAYQILLPLKNNFGFKSYGAYALATLMSQHNHDITEVMECYMWAIDQSRIKQEKEDASNALKRLYEQHYK